MNGRVASSSSRCGCFSKTAGELVRRRTSPILKALSVFVSTPAAEEKSGVGADESVVIQQAPEPLVPGRGLLDRRAFVQLAATFGLSLTVPALAAKSAATPVTADETTLIGEVSELIIPTTDTGGAIAAGVPAF